MTEATTTTPRHRRRWTALAGTAMLAAVGVGAAMLGTGHALDPGTASVGVLLVLATGAVAIGDLVPRRRIPDLHDEVDADTGVGNARAALALLDRESDRARTYGSVFSVAVLEVERPLFAGLHPRRAHRVLVDLVRGVAGDVRAGDRVCRVPTTDRELVAVVLPDTGATGARTFAERMLAQARRHLLAEGLPPHGHVRTEVLTHPGDERGVALLQRRLEVLEGTDALVRDVTIRLPRAARSRATSDT